MKLLLTLFVAVGLMGCSGTKLDFSEKAKESINVIDLEPVDEMPIFDVIDPNPNTPPVTTHPIPKTEEEIIKEEAEEFYALCTEFLRPVINLPSIPEEELMTIGLQPAETAQVDAMDLLVEEEAEESEVEVPENIAAEEEIVNEEPEMEELLPVVEDENSKLVAELIDIELGNFHGDYEIIVPVGNVRLGNTKGNITIESAQTLKSGNFKGSLIVKSLVSLISLGNTATSEGNAFIKTQFSEKIGNFTGKFCLGAAEYVDSIGNYSGILMIKGTGGERIDLRKLGNFKGGLILENVTVERMGNVRGLIMLKNSIIKKIGNNKANIINI